MDAAQVQQFYRVGVLGLRVLDGRDAARRRFGPDAEARWQLFKGELGDGDRLDLILRDAAVTHPAAFAPRVVFAIDGLAEDEPFGPDWPGPEPTAVAGLLADDGQAGAGDIRRLLQSAAAMWGLQPRLVADTELESVGPATSIVAAGPGVVLSLACLFAARSGLDFADQVVLLGDHPGERQLFGLANVMLETTSAVRVLRCDTATEEARAVVGRRVDRFVVSADADDNQRRAIAALQREVAA